ncbi:phage tail tape measure protein, partial [Acinetobacter johnsonii]|uniref:phage tail tape measure protein n=1 Tax=Acinetobacter johnsonii TaxID=40214 RepID=UPI00244AEBCD
MANKKLSAIITIGGEVAGSLRTAIGSTTTQLGKIGSEIKRVKKNQAMLGESIRTFGSMGKNVDNLRARYSSVTDELNRLTKSQEKLNRVESARLRNQEKFQELKSQIGATVATAVTFGAPIVMAAKFETSMLGIAKQLDGARDKSGQLTPVYHDMVKQVQLLGRELPIATNEIGEMVTAGLRMGVAKDEVVEFTRVAAKMGTAFELPVGELSENMGKIANMYKIPIKNIEGLADSINYLDDNAIAKGGDII